MTVYLLPFEKMHGLGNDFIMLERRHLPNDVDKNKLSKLLCNRHFSIGADGIIIIDFSKTKNADFEWQYYNSDGSEAEMCGNGMRCFAKYVYEKGFTDENSFFVLTKVGMIKPTLESDGTVTVDMGVPLIPVHIKDEIKIETQNFFYTYIEIGNPHCVIFLNKEISDEEFYYYGPKIEKNIRFKNHVNVEFAVVVNKSEIKCRVWERGAGPTLACGSGASAVLVAGCLNNLINQSVKVHLPGGTLNVWWDGAEKSVYLNGPAEFTFSGQYNLDPKLVL